MAATTAVPCTRTEEIKVEYEDLENMVMDFFGDTTRSAAETKRDLLALAEKCRDLASTIEDEAADDDAEEH